MRKTEHTDDFLANPVNQGDEFQEWFKQDSTHRSFTESNSYGGMQADVVGDLSNSFTRAGSGHEWRERQHLSAGDTMTVPSREEIDARIQASEARTETRITRLDGKIDLLVTKVDSLGMSLVDGRRDGASNRNAIIGTVLATGLALAALLVAAVTYGDAIFGRGMQVRDVVNSIANEIVERQASSQRRSQPAPP